MNGLTVFHSSANDIQVNYRDEDEEAEELADQIRRNEEIAANLNKFLDVQDDMTLDTQEESIHEEQPRFSQEVTRLQNELQAKTNEVEYFRKQVAEEQRRASDLQKKLVLAEAEKERAILTRNQTHELLIESKTAASEAKNREDQLRKKLAGAEEKNSSLEVQVQQANTMLSDLQHKLHILEMEAGRRIDSRTDSIVKQIQAKHQGQVELMQGQIEQLTFKVEERDKSLKQLETRYSELQKSREMLMLENSETINNLMQRLEESQRQACSQADFSEINAKLQRELLTLRDENNCKQKEIDHLSHRLEATSKDLHLMETLVGDMDSNLLTKPGSLAESTPIQDRSLKSIKSELHRALVDIKSKREEVRQLELEVERLKTVENSNLIQITELKEQNTRQANRIKFLMDEEEALTDRLRQIQRNCEHFETLYTQASVERLVESCKSCQEKQEAIIRLEERNDHLQRTQIGLEKEIAELKTHISDLSNQVSLKEYHDKMVEDLNEKVKEFEEFMQKDSRNVSTSPIKVESRNQSVNTSRDEELQQLREDLSKKYADEVKTVEREFKARLESQEGIFLGLKRTVEEKENQLIVRTKEVEMLKIVIEKERAYMKGIIAQKEEEARGKLKQCTEKVRSCEESLLKYREQVQELRSKLEQRDLLVSRCEKRVQALEAENSKLEERVVSMKKTKSNYEKYIEEKEQHLIREEKRLRTGYQEAAESMEKRSKMILRKKELQFQKQVEELEKQYNKKIAALEEKKQPSEY